MTARFSQLFGGDRPLTRAAGAFDRAADRALPLALVIAATILAVHWPFNWTGNEENYFSLALRTARPQAFDPASAVFDAAQARLVGFRLIGEVVALLGYERAHLLLTLVAAALLGWGIARLMRVARLSALDGVWVLLLFIGLGQSPMGGGAFVGGVEPKTFAFALGMMALADAIDGRRWRVALLGAAATYFHVQGGLIWTGLALLAALAGENGVRRAAAILAAFVVLVLPEAWLCIADLRRGARAIRPAGMPSADYIYTILRNPHHVAPFARPGGWPMQALRGVGYCGVMLAIAALALRRPEPALRRLGTVVAALCLFLPAAVVASWFDRETGALGKLYLFRPAAPLLLLALILFAALWRRESRPGSLQRLLPIGTLIAAGTIVMLTTSPHGQSRPLMRPEAAMIAAVQARTRPGEIVLLDPALDPRPVIVHKLERPTLVIWKFVPTDTADIYRWYALIEARRAAFAGDCGAIHPAARWLVATPATRAAVARCGRAAWTNGAFTLFARR